MEVVSEVCVCGWGGEGIGCNGGIITSFSGGGHKNPIPKEAKYIIM